MDLARFCSVGCLLVLLMQPRLSSSVMESGLVSEITNVRPLDCDHGPIQTNVTLQNELRAGNFFRLGMAATMATCIQLCCEKDDCEMALMPGDHCYGVDCFSEKHCEVTAVKPGNVTVQIAAVRPIAVNPPDRLVAVERPLRGVKDELHCTQSPILGNVTVRGGVKAGNFTNMGEIGNMRMCIALCCERRACDLAFMIGNTCIAVDCFSEELCQAVRARPYKYKPQLAYIRRRQLRKSPSLSRKADLLPTKPRSTETLVKTHEIVSDKLPHRTILKMSTCSTDKINQNVTLLGGIKSGNFTSLGQTKNMQECIGKTCELGTGDLAFMLGSFCYSVTCSSDRVCRMIPALPSSFYPRLAFLRWAPKINEIEVLPQEDDRGTDFTEAQKCTRGHILYNHTLLGGLRAGNFTRIAEVDSIQTCAALCCAEQTCDLALLLGENCYSGDCASKELCAPVPVSTTQLSQIAYITSRRKAGDESIDWSLWYIVVGSIAIGIGVMGIMWTVCTCYSRRRRLYSNAQAGDKFRLVEEYQDPVEGLVTLPHGWSLEQFGQKYNNQVKLTRNGPLFLSDTESDTEEEEDETAMSLKDQAISPGFSGRPPPSYSAENKGLGPNRGMLPLDSRAKRAMQNL